MRSLALSVDAFESRGESILEKAQHTTRSPLMDKVCNSPNEAALALQSLPLLYLAGCSSPRFSLTMGHSPVALSVLLSEVFLSMCPPQEVPESLTPSGIIITQSKEKSEQEVEVVEENKEDGQNVQPKDKHMQSKQSKRKKIRLGVVSGSLDGVPGKIVVGLLESIRRENLGVDVELIAMCFPTPRDRTTDRANAVFNEHINLDPENKTAVISRILDARTDFILFADAALDSRVFALAHERLATWQGGLWGWGGSLGINTLDFYFAPEPLLAVTSCPIQTLVNPSDVSDDDDEEDDLFRTVNRPPQSLYSEQVVLLKGLPPLPTISAANRQELWNVLQKKYLMPPASDVHLYLFPGSVRHMHPEFDAVLEVLLKRDAAAMVVLAVPRVGRDNLPTVHFAVRHDLMHPTMPAAAVAKLRHRLQKTLGTEAASRVRVLPPLDEHIYHALRRHVIAVLDPFPVGTHVQVLEALKEGIPVISAPALQECTASHMPGIARALQLSFWDWPTTAEEYAVLALRMQREQSLQMQFVPPDSLRTSFIPRKQGEGAEGGGGGGQNGKVGVGVRAYIELY